MTPTVTVAKMKRAYSTVAPVHTVEIYNPGTNTWTTGAPMPTARYQESVVTGSDGPFLVTAGNIMAASNAALDSGKDPAEVPVGLPSALLEQRHGHPRDHEPGQVRHTSTTRR